MVWIRGWIQAGVGGMAPNWCELKMRKCHEEAGDMM